MSNKGIQNKPENTSEQVIEKFLANQSKELDIREKEIAERQSSHDQQLNYAGQVLNANKDVELKRISESSKNRYALYFFISFLILVITGFALIALYLNKDAIVNELIHDVCYFFAGSIGGYGLAVIKNKGKLNKDHIQD